MKQDTGKDRAAVRLRIAQRSQVVTERLDDLLPAGHPARTIWEITGALDLSPSCESIRAILGAGVTSEGVDYEQSEPMRQQVEERTGQKVEEHLSEAPPSRRSTRGCVAAV
jgi:hypothetical protein